MNDKVKGISIMAGSMGVLSLYTYFIFFTKYAFLLLAFTGFLAVAGATGLFTWVGYSLYDPPKLEPLEMPDESEALRE